MVKKKKLELTHQKVIVWLGYMLFGVIIIGTILSTVIPWSQLLLQPYVRHWNVSILLLTLVAGAILPVLIAYFIGDKTTRGKNKLMHHYNGVLFGVLAFWLSLLFSFIGSNILNTLRMSNLPDSLVSVISMWPILATVIILVVIAITHTRSHKNGSVLTYTPYQALLLVCVAVSSALPLIIYLAMTRDNYFQNLLSVIVPVVFILISYLILRKRNKETRINHLMLATLIVSMGLITVNVVNQVLPYGVFIDDPINIISSVVSIIVGVAVWIFCLWSARHTS